MVIMSRWTFLSSFLLLWNCLGRVGTYPSGAPVGTCGDMVPRHLKFVPQTSPSPYFLQPQSLSLKSGSRMKLMLSSPEDIPTFLGFMIHAKPPSGAGEPVGGFYNLPESVKTITCGSNLGSTATHKDRNDQKSIELEWEAPADYEGPVVFNATFVQNGATFWVGVESDVVRVVKRSLSDEDSPLSNGISTTKTPIRLTTVPNYTLRPESKDRDQKDPIYEGCDSVKSCFGIPDGCIDTKSCLVMATTFVRGENYEFELMARNSSKGSPKYVALGLSHDQKMGGDSVTECVVDSPNKVNLYMSHNVEDGKNNERLNNLGEKVTLKHSKFEDGSIYCKFTRDTLTTVKGREYDLVNGQYYLLLASGTGLKVEWGLKSDRFLSSIDWQGSEPWGKCSFSHQGRVSFPAVQTD